MQVSKDEFMDGSKGSYRHAYCPAESMDQLFLAWQGVHDGEGGRRQPMPLCYYPTQPLCNVAGDTRVSEALMQQGSAHFGASSYASCSRPASLPQIRGVEYSGAGRLGMGLHDSMRRLAKIARNAHGHLVLDIDLPQSRATCLAASSLAPLHNNSGLGVDPDLDPTIVRCSARMLVLEKVSLVRAG
jgi:hypothetical protein